MLRGLTANMSVTKCVHGTENKEINSAASMTRFWVLPVSNLMSMHQCFRGTYSSYLHG
jgi:hypothetical protein